MLSLRNLLICLRHSNKLVTNRQWMWKASSYVTISSPLPSSRQDTWRVRDRTQVTSNTRVGFHSPFCTRVGFHSPFCTRVGFHSGSSGKISCWSCCQPVEETPAFFCLSCKVVQPPDEGASYFQIMDCEQTFALDTRRLQKRYLHLQRSLHPDNFSQKTPKEQEYSECQSALVNRAYRTLLKPLSRGLYMLELEGVTLGEGTDPTADPHFLLEVMEINEALQAAGSTQEANSIGQSTKEKLEDLTEQIDASMRKGELQAAKAFLLQMKYFANIEEKVKEKRSKLM